MGTSTITTAITLLTIFKGLVGTSTSTITTNTTRSILFSVFGLLEQVVVEPLAVVKGFGGDAGVEEGVVGLEGERGLWVGFQEVEGFI